MSTEDEPLKEALNIFLHDIAEFDRVKATCARLGIVFEEVKEETSDTVLDAEYIDEA